jgi:hypothetical protein
MRTQDKNNDGETYGSLLGFTFAWSFEATQGPEGFARSLLLFLLTGFMISFAKSVEGTHSTSVAVSLDARRSRRKVTFRQNAESAFFMGDQAGSRALLHSAIVTAFCMPRVSLDSAARGWASPGVCSRPNSSPRRAPPAMQSTSAVRFRHQIRAMGGGSLRNGRGWAVRACSSML